MGVGSRVSVGMRVEVEDGSGVKVSVSVGDGSGVEVGAAVGLAEGACVGVEVWVRAGCCPTGAGSGWRETAEQAEREIPRSINAARA